MSWSVWVLVALVMVVAIGLTWRIAVYRATRGRRRALDAAAHGRAMEAQAPALLERRGFAILEQHPQRRYPFTVDGTEHEAFLRADLLVERDGRRFVVEIKTGRAAKPTLRDTRRQLLEYALHYEVDAVLLLDADQDALTEVAFALALAPDPGTPEDLEPSGEAAPEAKAPPARSRARGFLLGFGCGVGSAVGIWWLVG